MMWPVPLSKLLLSSVLLLKLLHLLKSVSMFPLLVLPRFLDLSLMLCPKCLELPLRPWPSPWVEPLKSLRSMSAAVVPVVGPLAAHMKRPKTVLVLEVVHTIPGHRLFPHP